MSRQVNIVLEKYDNEELAEANELIGDLLINANIENKRLKAENAKLRELCEYLWEFAKTCGADHLFMRELGIEVEL